MVAEACTFRFRGTLFSLILTCALTDRGVVCEGARNICNESKDPMCHATAQFQSICIARLLPFWAPMADLMRRSEANLETSADETIFGR